MSIKSCVRYYYYIIIGVVVIIYNYWEIDNEMF